MRNQFTTPEFWAALVGQVIGMVVLFGGLTDAQAVDMQAGLESLIGGAISVLTVLGYIKSQGVRKQVAAELTIAKLNAVRPRVNAASGEVAVNTQDIDDLIKKI